MRVTAGAGFVCVTLVFACGGSKTPTAASPAVTALRVGIAANASPTISAGETRQLVAEATQTDGTTLDVTAVAAWQSSAPAVGTISGSGLLTTAAEGSIDVTATYKGARGSLHLDVQPSCVVSVNPSSASFTAFGGNASVAVTVNSPACRWTAHSDQPWFPLSVQPSAAGSGSFAYALPPNSTTNPRAANVIVSTSSGVTAVHAISEGKPAGCSYVTDPAEVTFTAAGGTGQFTVVTTPADCRWNLINDMYQLGVSVLSGFSGTGSGLVRYSVQAHTRTVDADGYLEIAGLSGQNPNGRYHIILLKR